MMQLVVRMLNTHFSTDPILREKDTSMLSALHLLLLTYLLGTIPGILVLGRVQALHARLDNVQRRVAEDAGGARDAAEHADHQLGHGFAGVALTVPVLQRFHHVKSAQKNP